MSWFIMDSGMDTHTFRIIGAELLHLLAGARVEKIHSPCPGAFAFTLFAGGRKRVLLLRCERQAPLLFFTQERPANPPCPPPAVMRLRKYCAGRRLGKGSMDYVRRALAFPVLVPPLTPPCWLLLDLVRGPSVLENLPSGFGDAPAWPKTDLTDALCSVPWQKKEKGGPWQEYAVLTPLLRETLSALDPLEGRALLADLETGGGGLFLYADSRNRPSFYAAWPLPGPLCARRDLSPCDPAEFSSGELPSCPALAAVSLVDRPKFFAALDLAAHREELLPERRSAKKKARLLVRLDQERERLTAMRDLREDAERIRGVLWRYPPDAKFAELRIAEEAGTGPTKVVSLNPLLTVRENMIRMFRQSARGARGLAVLRERRIGILASEPEEEAAFSVKSASGSGPMRMGRGEGREGPAPERKNGGNVARFVSSDGFVLLRGKNAQGNHALLKTGGPHDLWFHVEDGPGAHVIIRLSHAAEEPPERTLREAAVLAGEKSWQRQGGKANVMVARLRHVHAVKGAAPGTVRVDHVLQSLCVFLDLSAFLFLRV
jgi:hypothetical protein